MTSNFIIPDTLLNTKDLDDEYITDAWLVDQFAGSNLVTWGVNNVVQLGNGNNGNYYSSPIQVGSLTTWKQVSTGFAHSAAIKTDGTMWQWGRNLKGQFGNSTTTNYSSPIQVGSLTTWQYVSCGYHTTAAVKTDRTLWTCGFNDNGQLGNGTLTNYSSPVQVGTLANWRQVSMSFDGATPNTGYAAAVKTDGTLWTWGHNNFGQLGIGLTTTYYSSPIQVGSLTTWKQVATGFGYVAAIKTDGTLWAWGRDNYGQLGNNASSNTAYYSSPVQVGSLTNWKQVSCSSSSTAAIKTDGTLWTWGFNGSGQIGNGTSSASVYYSSPIQVGSLTNWKQVSCTGNGGTGTNISVSVAATKTDGTLWMWGSNIDGQLGNGAGGVTVYYSSPIQVGSLTNWKQVDTGYLFTAGLQLDSTITTGTAGSTTGFKVTDSNTNLTQDLSARYVSKSYLLDVYPNLTAGRTSPQLMTWGTNTQGQLGNGTTTTYSSPIQIGSLTNWKQVASGNHFAATIKTDGTLWTWGENIFGELANSTTTNYSSPIQVGGATTWKQVACGNSHLAATKTDGTLWTCGYNLYGQLGNGNTTNYSSPIQVGTLTNWKQVAGSSDGYGHSAAVKIDGTLWAWGRNNGGQIGNGNSTNYSSPIQVGGATTWKQVACGYQFTSAVKTDGTLWMWGRDNYGQLGNGTTSYYSSPIQVGSLTNWSQVACGYQYTAAVKTDGTLWTWGYNGTGQLGNGTITAYSSPIQVGTLTNWKQVASGEFHTMAVKTDGTLWGCGYNTNYNLGLGNSTHYSSPVQVGSLTTWKQVAAGRSHTITIQDGYI